jgi:outer membrane biosynthesis protein TonB
MKKVLSFIFLSIISVCAFATTADISDTSKVINLTSEHIRWEKTPKIETSNTELQGKNRKAIVKVLAEKDGNILRASIIQTTGISSLDEKIIHEVKRSKLIVPENLDQNISVIVITQPFTFKVNEKLPWWKKILFID